MSCALVTGVQPCALPICVFHLPLPTHQLPPFRSTPYHEPIYPLRFSSCQIGSEAYSTTVTKDLGPERSTTAASDLLRLLSSPTSAPCRTDAPIPCASSPSYRSPPRASARRTPTLASTPYSASHTHKRTGVVSGK